MARKRGKLITETFKERLLTLDKSGNTAEYWGAFREQRRTRSKVEREEYQSIKREFETMRENIREIKEENRMEESPFAVWFEYEQPDKQLEQAESVEEMRDIWATVESHLDGTESVEALDRAEADDRAEQEIIDSMFGEDGPTASQIWKISRELLKEYGEYLEELNEGSPITLIHDNVAAQGDYARTMEELRTKTRSRLDMLYGKYALNPDEYAAYAARITNEYGEVIKENTIGPTVSWVPDW